MLLKVRSLLQRCDLGSSMPWSLTGASPKGCRCVTLSKTAWPVCAVVTHAGVKREHGPDAADELMEGLVLLREQANRCARFWACSVCDQKFQNSKDYLTHVEQFHEEVRPAAQSHALSTREAGSERCVIVWVREREGRNRECDSATVSGCMIPVTACAVGIACLCLQQNTFIVLGCTWHVMDVCCNM